MICYRQRHLARLVNAGLLSVERQGRGRYFRLAGPSVAEALEALARISPPEPIRSLRQGTRAQAWRVAPRRRQALVIAVAHSVSGGSSAGDMTRE